MSYQHWQEISSYLDELDKERAVYENGDKTTAAMDFTRKSMVQLIENLRSSLEKFLDKQHTSLIIFAIVAAVDEKMQSYDFSSSSVKWAPIQKDFYAAYTAGEVFYKSIDEILEDPSTPNIVYQVYYAMLKRGFRGKYQDSKTQVAKYLDMLKDKIPVERVAEEAKEEVPNFFRREKEQLKKWHYYALSFSLFAFLSVGLYFISNLSVR